LRHKPRGGTTECAVAAEVGRVNVEDVSLHSRQQSLLQNKHRLSSVAVSHTNAAGITHSLISVARDGLYCQLSWLRGWWSL